MKTIKQIADEIGVSKTAVRKKITPELKTKFAETVSGVIHISAEGESLIKSAFLSSRSQTEFAGVSENQFAGVSGQVSTLISMLQKELDIKNQQIESLTVALENTTASLHAAQALHAGTMQKQLTDGDSDQPEPDTPSKRFFARIFGRKSY